MTYQERSLLSEYMREEVIAYKASNPYRDDCNLACGYHLPQRYSNSHLRTIKRLFFKIIIMSLIHLPANVRYYLYNGVTNMRCSFNGLTNRIRSELSHSPLSALRGSSYIFQ